MQFGINGERFSDRNYGMFFDYDMKILCGYNRLKDANGVFV